MDLSCWMDIEEFRKMDPKLTDEADTKAREIKQKYFNKKYFFGPNSPASREGLDKVCEKFCKLGFLIIDISSNANSCPSEFYRNEMNFIFNFKSITFLHII